MELNPYYNYEKGGNITQLWCSEMEPLGVISIRLYHQCEATITKFALCEPKNRPRNAQPLSMPHEDLCSQGTLPVRSQLM